MTTNIGNVNRELGVMTPRVISHCIDDALDNGETGPNVSLDIGIRYGKNNYSIVDVDSLSNAVKRRMITANSDCGIWFREFDTYVFTLLSDEQFPWTSLQFSIPETEILKIAQTKSFAQMKKLEAFKYIEMHCPTLIAEVKECVHANDNSLTLEGYVDIFSKVWDEDVDTRIAVSIIENAPITVRPTCSQICILRQKYPDIPESSYTKLIGASLRTMWTKANYNQMTEEDRDQYKKIYKLSILKNGIPR